MPRRSPAHTTRQLLDLGVAVPQVVGQRLMRMAAAGTSPSARDRRELAGMVLEKQTAFVQSWMAMWLEAGRLQQQWAWSWWQGAGMPANSLAGVGQAWEQILGSGLAPIRRKAVANARRLSRRVPRSR
jgi:hypothetical protein